MIGQAAGDETGARQGLAHIPALDGLRGVAVAAVLAFHDGRLTGGYLGVDLFFVLSGFLITSLLLAEWGADQRISLGRFWARRARRLLPALLLLVAVVTATASLWVDPTARSWLHDEALATLAYVANWHTILAGGGYWQQTAGPTLLQHTWSLAIEEQFYVLWPLVVGAVLGRGAIGRDRDIDAHLDADAVRSRVSRLTLVAAAGALASAALMVGLALAGADLERLYLGTDTRIAAVLLGAVAAGLYRLHLDRLDRGWPRTAVALGAWGGVAVLAYAWLRIPGGQPGLYRGGLFVCGLAAATVVLHLASDRTAALGRVLALWPLRALGIISYGLYLWHWPIFQVVRADRVDWSRPTITVVRVALSLTAAVASYLLVERPVRAGALAPSLVRLATPVGFALVLVAVVVGTRGAIDPIRAAARPADGFSAGPPEWPTMMVVGDSAAQTLAQHGIVPTSPDLEVRALDAARHACSLLVTQEKPTREQFAWDCSHEWPGLLAEHDPDIVLAFFGAWTAVPTVTVDGEEGDACSPGYRRYLLDRLDRAFDELSSAGAHVVVATAPRPGRGWGPLADVDPDVSDAWNRCANAIVVESVEAHPAASLVDLAGWMCPGPEGACRDDDAGPVEREDGMHYRGDAARAVSRWLVPEVLRAAG